MTTETGLSETLMPLDTPPRQAHREGELRKAAARIARMAGEQLKSSLFKEFSVEHKGEIDLVTDVDRETQDLIEREILNKYPDHGILAEEDLNLREEAAYLWIVDPLDGTTNYAHRFPFFAVSIAVMRNNEPLCGVVFNPLSDEMFTAVRGGGASLNDLPIRVSGTRELGESLLGTGFPYDIRQTQDNNLDHFADFSLVAQDIRRCGSAALDLCFVACGRIDGFWEMSLKPWDVAAGCLIVREAGGRATDFNGSESGVDGSQILASNGIIHEQMMKILDRGS